MELNKNLLDLLIFSLLFLSERISKLLVISSGYNYKINTGLAFSGFSNLPNLIINISSVIGLLLFFIYFKHQKMPSKITRLGFILITSGGISNLFDRILFRGVIDYISLSIFPMFNLADIFIVSGSLLLVLRILK